MKLDEKLVRLRKEKGLTQLELAEAMKVSRQAVSRWELGTVMPSTENLRGLSELYGVPIDYLLNDDEQEIKTADSVPQKTEDNPERPCRNTEKSALAIKLVAIALLFLVFGISIGMTIANKQNEERNYLYLGDMKGEYITGVPRREFSIEW